MATTFILRDGDNVIVAYGTGATPGEGQHAEEVPAEVIEEARRLYADHPLSAGVTWDGATLGVLPDDPGKVAAAAAAAARASLKTALAGDTSAVDPAVVTAALGRLDAIIATGSVSPLPASPTNAEVVEQVRILTTAVNIEADAIRDIARILRATIRVLS